MHSCNIFLSSRRDALGVWGSAFAKFSARSPEERRKSIISIPWLVLQGLHRSAASPPSLFMLHYIVHTLLSRTCWTRPSAARCPASRWWNICVCFSVCRSVCHFPPPLCFSRFHIMSLSLAGHVDTCTLGPGPSVCQGEGDIWWAKWTEASGNRFHLRASDRGTLRKAFSFFGHEHVWPNCDSKWVKRTAVPVIFRKVKVSQNSVFLRTKPLWDIMR